MDLNISIKLVQLYGYPAFNACAYYMWDRTYATNACIIMYRTIFQAAQILLLNNSYGYILRAI